MVSQLIPSTRSGCTKEGQMEAVPQSTFTGVSVLTHSSAFSFLSGCAGTAPTPPLKLFLPCCLLSCFSRAFLLPACVSSSSWMLCFLQKQQIAVMLSFWSNEKHSYNNDVHVFLSILFTSGAWRHTSLPGSYFFCRSCPYCHWSLSFLSPSPKAASFPFVRHAEWSLGSPPQHCAMLVPFPCYPTSHNRDIRFLFFFFFFSWPEAWTQGWISMVIPCIGTANSKISKTCILTQINLAFQIIQGKLEIMVLTLLQTVR